MYTLSSRIDFKDFSIDYVNNITIKSSYENLTDTCEITLPKKYTVVLPSGEKYEFKDYIKRGEKVTVNLMNHTATETLSFEGYVTSISQDYPIKITMEDEMYLLKKGNVNKTWKEAKLSDVLKELGLKNSAKGFDQELGKVIIPHNTPAQVLKFLRDTYNIFSYYKGDKFYSGLAFDSTTQSHIEYDLRNDVVSNNLEYVTAEDVRLKVKAVSILAKSNKKLEVEVGDPDGDTRTLTFYDIKSEAELKKVAEAEMKKYRFDGYRGSFTTWGTTIVSHGDKIRITDSFNTNDKPSSYLVKSVEYTFGIGGFRQKIELDVKL